MDRKQHDWLAWHQPYEDKASALSRRLALVQSEIRRLLPEKLTDPFTVVSLCTGQGHDLLGVLQDYPDAAQIRARLVELDGRNVAMLRDRATRAGLAHLQIVHGDAADTTLHEGIVPADLVLVCGVFGNISDADIWRTIAALPQMTKVGGSVIWTRSRRPPDLTPRIRQAFQAAEFTETAFHAPDDVLFSVGACRFHGESQPLQATTLFTFITSRAGSPRPRGLAEARRTNNSSV
jgi:hypothetical protein